ncbi:hypothetical protein DWB61_17190 [Ancylomarina euxinus]|uniref:Uncharacterized protein n=1 Tax=Ancylomarina euxinus TaxID=2283627 RepID=A0A425XWJ8_9BACT|nr:hypothetical protein [Ancylomarina euxinus]MCZ4696406.1 hypothetical protein [Ancylomarina euxinus]RRG19015.1 hypothetical protein DWB61_17190 [Ancylomarina euxinus]
MPEDLHWINNTIPFIYLSTVAIVMLKTKWYYNLSILFYPFLMIFWFIPKSVLNKGKIYLLSGYANLIFTRIKKYKSTFIHMILVSGTILLLSTTDYLYVKIFSMVYFAFIYYKIVIRYVKQSFQPAQIFGADIDKTLDQLIESPEQSYKMIKSFEENKEDEKLPEDERNFKRIKRLIIANSIVEFLGTNLTSFKGKRAFVVSWIYQLVGFVFITFTFYTFLNFQLYHTFPESFNVTGIPHFFDFIYYTIKTVTFGNIESIVPVGIIARVIEMLSFLTVGVFILIIVTSVIFSMRQDKINANIQKATQVCLAQNKYLVQHIQERYNVDINTVLNEASSIKESVENIRKTIERLL